MHETSPLLHFAEDKLQIMALLFMGTIYALKIRWILRHPAGKERQARTGSFADTNGQRGAKWSLFMVGMPWAMSSTRQHPLFYIQFVLFHIAVASSILMSFVIPYGPGLIASQTAILVLQTIFALGFAVGILRLIRRLTVPVMRKISTPDDIFSLALLIVWLAFSFLATPNNRAAGESSLLAYFFLTAFFLIYVPFSKISHYIYYPFSRWYLGRTLGHRGTWPLRRSPSA